MRLWTQSVTWLFGLEPRERPRSHWSPEPVDLDPLRSSMRWHSVLSSIGQVRRVRIFVHRATKNTFRQSGIRVSDLDPWIRFMIDVVGPPLAFVLLRPKHVAQVIRTTHKLPSVLRLDPQTN